jgi:hypothetical protein
MTLLNVAEVYALLKYKDIVVARSPMRGNKRHFWLGKTDAGQMATQRDTALTVIKKPGASAIGSA